MSKLGIIVRNEYLTDIRAKSFWITTFILPIIMIVFGGVFGYLATESDTLLATSNPLGSSDKDMSGWQVMGMISGILLTMFIMIYGAQIFNKVKTEKSNRIMEVLATCVDGRTMMMAKIVSVALIGLTQLAIWFLLGSLIVAGIVIVGGIRIPLEIFTEWRFYTGLLWSIAFFIGGYLFYGSMFAAVGAMSDKNQENQEYMSIITFILLASFYIGQFSADNIHSALSTWCMFIPFTSATVGAIGAVGGEIPLWQSLLSLASLLLCAAIMVSIAGKLYRSVLLLKGKRLSPADMITFLKTK